MAWFRSVLIVFCCLLMLTLHAHAATTNSFFDFFKTRRVRIINDISNRTKLTIQCGSQDDDLGEHVLNYQGHFEWKFKLHWLRLTLFWCRFKWDNRKKFFDVFETERDEDRCLKKCWWSIRKDGAYYFSESNNSYGQMFAWPVL